MSKSIPILGFLIASSFAQCPDFTPFQNLNLTEYAGVWRSQAVLTNFETDPRTFQCIHAFLRSDDWTSEPVVASLSVHGENEVQGSEFSQEFGIRISSLSEPAKWTWLLNGPTDFPGPTISGTSVIIDTDYRTALIGNCYRWSNNNTTFITLEIVSRAFGPLSQAVRDRYEQIKQTYGIAGKIYNYETQQSAEVCANHVSV